MFMFFFWASLVAQWWRICLSMQQMWVGSLGQEDLLEEEIATHSSICAWRIPRTAEPSGLQFMSWQRVGRDLVTKWQQWICAFGCPGSWLRHAVCVAGAWSLPCCTRELSLFQLWHAGSFSCSTQDLVSCTVTAPGPLALSLSHWTTKEVPLSTFLWQKLLGDSVHNRKINWSQMTTFV